MNHSELLAWLRETDDDRLEILWGKADQARREHVGDAVHLRGLIEFSNYCARRCAYCGLHVDNQGVTRYRMSMDEVMVCVRLAHEFGYGTVVLQSGEDYGMTTDWMADLIRRIKSETPLAVTLSLGERSHEDLTAWREAGADRYLLRFETSNPDLYRKIHPDLGGRISDRISILNCLRELGYEVGSGVMIGIPGQTYDDLATDLLCFRDLELDMIGVGPYIPHPDTVLGRQVIDTESDQQPPRDERMVYKMVALTRIMCPWANIPSTTALATLNLVEGRELGLMRGANVVMPNLTPPEYRVFYEIYPSKACIRETAKDCHGCMGRRIESIGRRVGTGRGDSRRMKNTVFAQD